MNAKFEVFMMMKIQVVVRGSKILWNVGVAAHHHTALQPRKPQFEPMFSEVDNTYVLW